ncbi:MAG: DUF3703 domain-containing protein [Pseudomonadota bacterium]
MGGFHRAIRPTVREALAAARAARHQGDAKTEFACLERAHILGQASTRWHVLVHAHMLWWGIRQRSLTEVVGQVLRIVGAATKTVLGWVPEGNTGGSNVNPFKPMPVPASLAAKIRAAKKR